MNKKLQILLILFTFIHVLLLFPSSVLASQKSIKELPERYQKWLTEDVLYIITSKEKEIFLQLNTDRERDIFIEAFWKQRDPIPSTPENELKTEHYRRINYVNKHFGRGTPTKGWRTDKGRIYIVLGEPQEIQKFEHETEIIPTEIWFYQGMVELGLPNAFNVVFIKRDIASDWELYSPVRDGPKIFLRFYNGDPLDIEAAYRQLLEIKPPVAYVSISLLPTSSETLLAPTMASEVLISRIYDAPKRKVEDEYAEKLLKYKDIIEVEYSANYIGSDPLIRIFQDEAGIFFVNYLLEPKKLSVEFYEDTYYTSLEINGQVTDSSGKTVFQFQKKIPIKFDQTQYNQMKSKLFSFQDAFPLVEGNYTFHLLLKNNVSKEFTSFEKEITVPSGSGFQMSPLLLAHTVKDATSTRQIKAFKSGRNQIYASPRSDFSRKDNLYVYLELYGIPPEIEERGKLKFAILKEGKEVWSESKELKDYSSKQRILEFIPLEKISPANYRLNVSVLDSLGNEILTEKAFFYISHRDAVPRPFIYAESLATSDNPVYDYILGGQFYNKGQLQKAETYLEKAYRKRPSVKEYAKGYSQILFILKKYDKVKTTLLPFVQGEEKNYDCLELLGKAYQALGEYDRAIENYKEYLAHFGTNLKILNAIGDCYWSVGKKEEAFLAWKKSLELEPNQEEIQEKVRSLEGKNNNE
jgi:GWxTD domain-containing protein